MKPEYTICKHSRAPLKERWLTQHHSLITTVDVKPLRGHDTHQGVAVPDPPHNGLQENLQLQLLHHREHHHLVRQLLHPQQGVYRGNRKYAEGTGSLQREQEVSTEGTGIIYIGTRKYLEREQRVSTDVPGSLSRGNRMSLQYLLCQEVYTEKTGRDKCLVDAAVDEEGYNPSQPSNRLV